MLGEYKCIPELDALTWVMRECGGKGESETTVAARS